MSGVLTFTYDSLTGEIQDWIEENDAEFTDGEDGEGLATIVKLAEERLLRDLDLEVFDVMDTSLTMVAGTSQYSLPATCVSPREFWYVPVGSSASSGARTPLYPKSEGYCRLYAPNPATQGTPKFWAHCGEPTLAGVSKVLIAPTPDAAYPVLLKMMQRPTSLVSDTGGTYLSRHFGAALFHACLIEVEIRLMADERAPVHEKSYLSALPQQVRERLMARRRDYKPIRKTPTTEETPPET